MHSHRRSGERPIAEMLAAEGRETVRAPRLSMRQQIEWDKKLEQLRGGRVPTGLGEEG